MQRTVKAGELLNSWKEIAAYLDRGVRTVQRWERELHLPVRRIGSGKRSPVCATVKELNFWISTTGAARARQQPQTIRAPRLTGKTIEDAHSLLSTAHMLAQAIAENSVRQRQQAEILQARIKQLRARMR
jgi:hypothetical protein